jgi:hypothetical protein
LAIVRRWLVSEGDRMRRWFAGDTLFCLAAAVGAGPIEACRACDFPIMGRASSPGPPKSGGRCVEALGGRHARTHHVHSGDAKLDSENSWRRAPRKSRSARVWNFAGSWPLIGHAQSSYVLARSSFHSRRAFFATATPARMGNNRRLGLTCRLHGRSRFRFDDIWTE